MANYNFRMDLAVAKETEKEVALLLEKVYNAETLEFSNNGDYDFMSIMNGLQYAFEVKEDFICEKTGNVGLEYEYRGKPSGIQTSKADYYIYKLHTKDGIRYVMHSIEALKQMVSDEKYFRIVNGGDKGSNSMFYLFKYDTFVETGEMIPTLDKIQ